jgi:dolichyl-phosphate-mannose--protein O-mannosyl transferase
VTSPPSATARTPEGDELVSVREDRPDAWRRALQRVRDDDPVVGWLSAMGVMLLAFLLRLWHLGSPREFQFDETYYAKDAWSLLHHGYVRGYVEDANDRILEGETAGLWTEGPSMIVHPDVGKWLIALGEKAFGMDPFGWRIAAAVVGSLMVLVMVRLARRLTGSTLLGCVAGLLLAVDGLHFVLSRLALLDIFVAFFVLCGVHCVVADRDWFRARLARTIPGPVQGWAVGPVRAVLLRPWLLAGGLSWGLAVGTKWTALYPLAAFGIMAWLWSGGARRSFGVRMATLRSAVVDGFPAFVQLVVVAGIVYVASWGGWLAHADAYEEHLSSSQYTRFAGTGHCDEKEFVADTVEDRRWPSAAEPDASGPGEVTQSLRSLASYHHDVYVFHTHFLNCATHTYASDPLGWPLLNRPVGVAADTGIQPGTRGCQAPEGSDCLRQVILLGTPLIWWGGAVALVAALLWWALGRDWRFGVAVVGALSSWLPWLFYDDRPIFSFYTIVMLPFTVLALTLAIGKLVGPDRFPSSRRTVGVVIAGAYVVLVLVNFAWFWPVYTNELLTKSEWLDRIWFSRWI